VSNIYNYYTTGDLSFTDASIALTYVTEEIEREQNLIRIRIEGMKAGKAPVFMRAVSASVGKGRVKSYSLYGLEDYVDIYPEYF
jgi:hypothetical protein